MVEVVVHDVLKEAHWRLVVLRDSNSILLVYCRQISRALLFVDVVQDRWRLLERGFQSCRVLHHFVESTPQLVLRVV